MAVVNITDKLRKEILEIAATPFAERYKEAATLSLEDSRYTYDMYFIKPAQVEALALIENSWVSLTHNENYRGNFYTSNKSERHWLMLQFTPQPLYFSYQWTYSPNNANINIESARNGWHKIDFAADPIFAPYLQKMEVIVSERDAILATIIKMLNGCKTINQVEKLWPAIRKYLPQEALERLDRKAVKKTIEHIGIDKEELDNLSVAHIRQQMIA